ncbi:hypothetical protein CAEBREN_02391 [Caenorhabditis brenneri]|uniref:Uncharacterized protein n=1 Tax=Caenorhabditis brenneri TaxID=135651 RepID=G0PBF9_CAEBE|nr:hypothetical protein CAEBREN_02391 [Caenorhabditis brenneri]
MRRGSSPRASFYSQLSRPVFQFVQFFGQLNALIGTDVLVLLRHLRSTKYRIYGSDWHKEPDENGNLPVIQNTPLPQKFSENLHKSIVRRVLLHVYDRIPMNCSLIPKELQKMLNHPDPCEQMWPSF